MCKALISYGGGVNSTALVILMFQKGFRFPVVYSDLGSEMPETNEFINIFDHWLKKEYGAEIIRLNMKDTPEFFEKRYKGFKTFEDYLLDKGLIPFFRFRWCSKDLKINPIERWSKKMNIDTHYIGFSAEEAYRAGRKRTGKIEKIFPLINWGIDREECKKIIKKAGLLLPPKSSCFFCLYRKKTEWGILKANYPVLFNRAIALEDCASKKMGRKVTMRPDGLSVRDIGEIREEQNPLFPELLDLSDEICPFCQL